jgi:glycosylphosphatidylinositol phospholipase D
MLHHRTLVVLLPLLAPPAAAQSLMASHSGAANVRAGTSMLACPDWNGDGIDDVIVGEPGFNSGRGRIVCLSGASLADATATGLWSLAPTSLQLSSDANFGRSLALLNDRDGDGRPEVIVGAPYQDGAAGTDCGAVCVVRSNAGTPSLHRVRTGDAAGDLFGWAVSAHDDRNSDGAREVIVGAPFGDTATLANCGRVYVVSGNALYNNLSPLSLATNTSIAANAWLGYTVAGNLRCNLDSAADYVAGAPSYPGFSGAVAGGQVSLYSGQTYAEVGNVPGAYAGANLGISLSAGLDFNLDGFSDVFAGAPGTDLNGTNSGRVLLIDGRQLFAGSPVPLINWNGPAANLNYGSAVGLIDDINNDGRPDIAIGATGYQNPTGSGNEGAVFLYSGESLLPIGTLVGPPNGVLGDGIASTGEDFDSDGAFDLLVAGAVGDSVATNGGRVFAARVFPNQPRAYCTGKTNSLGCVPSMTWQGSASLSSTAPFLLRAINVLNQKSGLVFYGFRSAQQPFSGGFLCVQSPTIRSASVSSGGSTSGNDCSGVISIDFNPIAQAGATPGLTLGNEIYAQVWSRDPAGVGTTSLSDGLHFLLNP